MHRVNTLIHLHTDYSYDSDISLDILARFLSTEGIDCIAVTDHDTIEGARRLRHLTDATVIVGEEISTRDGHLIGLFLCERVRPGMSARDTAVAIQGQGGLVLLPHPFVRALSCGLGKASWEIVDLVNAVEVNNAQNVLRRPDREAEGFAQATGLPGYVGADSHMAMSIAPCYQIMPAFDGPAEFLNALRSAELCPGRHPLGFFVATGYRLICHYAGLPLSGGFGAKCRPEPGHLTESPPVPVA